MQIHRLPRNKTEIKAINGKEGEVEECNQSSEAGLLRTERSEVTGEATVIETYQADVGMICEIACGSTSCITKAQSQLYFRLVWFADALSRLGSRRYSI